MGGTVAIGSSVAVALAASVLAVITAKGFSDRAASSHSATIPVLVRCPRASDHLGQSYVTADQVIAVARRVNHREVTHYQGQAVRRTRWNTPGQSLVMYVCDKTLNPPGR